MRISDDRYSRDRRRLDLALRFIQHEARTQTIRTWTGLTDDRIRKLYRSYLHQPGRTVPRPRGRSPQQTAFFIRSPRLRQETALLASLASLLGLLPPRRTPAATLAPPCASQGLALCEAYEAYRALVPSARISFEHMIFLITALLRGDELKLAGCAECGAVLVIERMTLREPRCQCCASGVPQPAQGAGYVPVRAEAAPRR